MLFYIALSVACVFIALVIIYLYNTLSDIGQVIYRALLPSSKTKFIPRNSQKKLATTVKRTLTPWGWDDHAPSHRAAPSRAVSSARQKPWGWQGNDHGSHERSHANRAIKANQTDKHLSHPFDGSSAEERQEPPVGWPYREEKLESSGKVYKVTRKATPRRTNLSTTGKPWGW